MITLQDPTECLQGKPRFREMMKPPCLSMIDDGRWNGFVSKLTSIVNRYWNEMLPFLFVPLAFLAIIGTFVLRTFAAMALPIFVGPGIAFAVFALVLGSRAFIVSQNCALDREISRLCSELSSDTQGSVSLQYRTAWTGFCKPKHARTARLIAFCPNSTTQVVGAPVQSIMVTVPAGVQAGQQLQVQTPMGLQEATVPAGVSPGETFTFTPAAVTTAPVVVQAQVVA